MWGVGTTFQNLVPGQPLFLQDPNCHCFDPTKQLVLNPAAWSDVGTGQYSSTAPYLNNYRWQRQPAESMSFGRIFPLAREGRVNLNVRIEFQNVFNRTFLSAPSVANPTASVFNTNQFANGTPGALSSGFGFGSSGAGRRIPATLATGRWSPDCSSKPDLSYKHFRRFSGYPGGAAICFLGVSTRRVRSPLVACDRFVRRLVRSSSNHLARARTRVLAFVDHEDAVHKNVRNARRIGGRFEVGIRLSHFGRIE